MRVVVVRGVWSGCVYVVGGWVVEWARWGRVLAPYSFAKRPCSVLLSSPQCSALSC